MRSSERAQSVFCLCPEHSRITNPNSLTQPGAKTGGAVTGPTVDKNFWNDASQFSAFSARHISNISSKASLLSVVDWQKISDNENTAGCELTSLNV